MDEARFDAWIRAWGTPSRRGLLRLSAASGLASLLSLPVIQDAAAKCVRPGKKCKKKNDKKKCCGGAKCQGKKCVCQGGTFGCGKHCCLPGQICQNVNGVPTCKIPIGGFCDPEEPDACESGVCGCTNIGCVCRIADCVLPGGNCEDMGSVGCCQGVCIIGNPDHCSV